MVAGGLPGEEYCRSLLMKESDWLQVDYLARNIALLMKEFDWLQVDYLARNIAAAASPQLLDQIIPHIGKAITRTFITRELLEKRWNIKSNGSF